MKSWLSRLFAGALVALALTSSAGATQKTIAQLTAEITSLFADNTSGAITPAKLRQVAQDTVDSYFNSLANVTGNTVLAGQAGGASGSAAFRALVGADLPVPSLTTLGGIKASSAVANQFMTSVSVAGAPVTAQPAFSNISGLLSTTQTSGSLDALTTCGTWGNVLFRGTAGWVCLAPGGAGTFLKSNGSGADVAWATPAGSGTVTSVGCGTGLTCAPSPIVGAGTVTLATPVTVANGGIGVGTLTANGVVLGNGTSALTVATIGTGGRLLIDKGAGTPPAFTAASQDCTVASTGVFTCTKTNNVAFGTAATLNVGVGASQIVQLNGSSQLPAVDGSLLTNIPTLWVPGSINGCTLSRASATTFGVAICYAANDNGGTGFNLTLASAFTKSLSAWAVGTGNGGLDTGAVAATTWYHVHLIRKDSDGSLDVLYSLSATAPTMPGGYTARRRLGSFKTDGSSQIIAFSQLGDEFLLNAAVVDIDATNPGTAAVTRTLGSVPTGVQVIAFGSAGAYGGTNAIIEYVYSSLDVSDQAPQTPGTAALTGFSSGLTSLTSTWFFSDFRIRTNTSGQIRSRIHVSGAADHVGVITRGWVDARGQ